WKAMMMAAKKADALAYCAQAKPFVVTERYAKSMGHYLVVQCGRDGNSDAAIFDLHYNPDDYTTMSAEELIGVMNSKAKAIRALRANRQPIMMPAELAPEGCKALKISADERDRRIKVIRDNKDFQDRVCTALANRYAD